MMMQPYQRYHGLRETATTLPHLSKMAVTLANLSWYQGYYWTTNTQCLKCCRRNWLQWAGMGTAYRRHCTLKSQFILVNVYFFRLSFGLRELIFLGIFYMHSILYNNCSTQRVWPHAHQQLNRNGSYLLRYIECSDKLHHPSSMP